MSPGTYREPSDPLIPKTVPCQPRDVPNPSAASGGFSSLPMRFGSSGKKQQQRELLGQWMVGCHCIKQCSCSAEQELACKHCTLLLSLGWVLPGDLENGLLSLQINPGAGGGIVESDQERLEGSKCWAGLHQCKCVSTACAG